MTLKGDLIKTELRRLSTGVPIANNHHHVASALAFPDVTYVNMKKSGKCFVYDIRRIYHGQMPIAEIIDNKLVKDGKVLCKGPNKKLLAYASEHLLQQL